MDAELADGRYVGRLAPSPTGLLHLGHARTFWIAWKRARAVRGRLWLREEDLDLHRAKLEYASAMKDDLHWLGIDWDGELRQRERAEFYREALHRLITMGVAYPCHCSRRELATMVAAPHDDGNDEPVYACSCRAVSKPERDRSRGVNYRFRVPEGEIVRFCDGSAREQTFHAGCDSSADFGDFLIWRKDGVPSYQLACAVDDAMMAVTEVVRGRDLLKSTARQILVQRALGYATPSYYHCELVRDEAGVRLAKRHDALSLRAMRERGLTPAEVRGLAGV